MNYLETSLSKKIESLYSLNCKINNLSVNALFQLYEKTGFIYPAKKERLKPYFQKIKSNWNTALKTPNDVLMIFTHYDEKYKKITSTSLWRMTTNTVLAQHLFSEGSLIGPRAVLLGSQLYTMNKQHMKAAQIFYCPSNKYASKLYNGLLNAFAPNTFYLEQYDYFAIHKSNTFLASSDIVVHKLDNNHANEVSEIVNSFFGKTYCLGEEFDSPDVCLENLNEVYKKIGLERYRSIWVAYKNETVLGIAIAYTGPLGFNFSFFENSCTIKVYQHIDNKLKKDVLNSLLAKLKIFYKVCPIDFIPVLADINSSQILQEQKFVIVRKYNKLIWLRNNFLTFYTHIEGIFEKYLKRHKQRV